MHCDAFFKVIENGNSKQWRKDLEDGKPFIINGYNYCKMSTCNGTLSISCLIDFMSSSCYVPLNMIINYFCH
jgi:hypothetical protein